MAVGGSLQFLRLLVGILQLALLTLHHLQQRFVALLHPMEDWMRLTV